jgi:hypothetical protein
MRPPPPKSLSDWERALWLKVTNSLPHDWFRPENVDLLESYCHGMTGEKYLDEMLDEMRAARIGGIEYQRLQRVRNQTAHTNAMIATKMRLTQQSRYRAHNAATATKQTSHGRGSTPRARGSERNIE